MRKVIGYFPEDKKDSVLKPCPQWLYLDDPIEPDTWFEAVEGVPADEAPAPASGSEPAGAQPRLDPIAEVDTPPPPPPAGPSSWDLLFPDIPGASSRQMSHLWKRNRTIAC